jgi:predicted nucleic acid-binding protein
MRYLVDTNVVSELLRPTPDRDVTAWARGLTRAALSAVTVEELFFGLSWKPNARVLAAIEGLIEHHFDLVEVTVPIARQAGTLRGQLQALGRPRTQADMLIAATAAIHGLTLVTRNERDFEGCGVTVINPFSTSDR